MSELLLHPKTREQIDALVRHTPHAVMISGARGSGKHTTALYAASQILKRQNIANYPYFLQITPDKNIIGIEAIRQIKAFLGKKTTGANDIRRIVLIGDAHAMTIEAQNALLKVLEEPPADTMLILTTSDINAFKATIVSRAQHVNILPVAKQAALDLLKNSVHSEQNITSAYHMSGGQTGLLIALLEQRTDHEVVSAITKAKEFLRMGTYERLLLADSLSKQKEQLELFLEGMQRVIASGLEQAALKNNQPQVKKFHIISSRLQEAQSALSKSANAKLALTNLFLQI